jgi:hypothetical protein
MTSLKSISISEFASGSDPEPFFDSAFSSARLPTRYSGPVKQISYGPVGIGWSRRTCHSDKRTLDLPCRLSEIPQRAAIQCRDLLHTAGDGAPRAGHRTPYSVGRLRCVLFRHL